MISKSSTACCLYLSPLIIAPSLEAKQLAFLPRSNRVWKSPDGWDSRTVARIRTLFLLHCTWSAFGTKQTSQSRLPMSAIGGKALLLTQSGHDRLGVCLRSIQKANRFT